MPESTDRYDTGRRLEELDPERPEPFDTPWGSFSIFVIDGRPLAVQSFCPHLLGPLFQGTVAGRQVTCPWHQWRFDLVTGACTHRPEGKPGAVIPLRHAQIERSERGTLVLLREPIPVR